MKVTTPRLTLGPSSMFFRSYRSYESGREVISICLPRLHQIWEFPKRTQVIWLEVSDEPSRNSVRIVTKRKFDSVKVKVGRRRRWEWLLYSAARYFTSKVDLPPDEETVLHVRLLYE